MANEKRLIDADALKALFDERYDEVFVQEHTRHNKQFWNGLFAGVNWGRNTIADAPTVDAVEVVHGRWIAIGGNRYTIISQCSNCCAKYDFTSPYCPNCGADMRERKDNESMDG